MITLLQEPGEICPAYNEQNFVVETDNYLQDGFKFVFDIVFLGDTTYTRRIKKNIYPGTTNKCVFNPQRIIENYLSHDIDLAITQITRNDNSWKGYVIRFGEEYGGVVYPNLLESDIKLAWNAIYDFLVFKFFSANDAYLIASGSEFHTRAPQTQNVNIDDKGWLYFAQRQTGFGVRYVEVKTYNSSDNLIQTIEINNPYESYTSSGDVFLRVPSHPASLNLIDNSQLTAGAQPIIDGSVARYTMQAFYVASLFPPTFAECSKEMRFNVKENCSEHDKFRLYFLNPRGGFDTFSFTLASKLTIDIRREFYKKPVGAFTSGVYGYNTSDRLTTQYFTEEKVSIQLTSDWISDAESVWLNDLLTSPVVYYDAGILIAVNITDVKYEVKKGLTDQLFNLTLTIQPSYTKQYQRQ